ncbi:BQ5605_C010g06172 [Microbotryum silenes-dioicae]|uniref:BQ5605_C010g06172 protein n=1 Tax=Microbotryum silenes-dioicae TaxID=796604 RepID=A0A2X0MBW5_9BASI|nr:BQ5605_C010g06172 [Microbotryum silenes-dioicae]
MLFKVSAALVLAGLSLGASALPSMSTESRAQPSPSSNDKSPYGRTGYIDSPADRKTTTYKVGDKIHFVYNSAPATYFVDVSLMLANGNQSFELANRLTGSSMISNDANARAYFRMPENLKSIATKLLEASQDEHSVKMKSNNCILAYRFEALRSSIWYQLIAKETQNGEYGLVGDLETRQAITISM